MEVLGHEWRAFGAPKPIRPFGSVILDGTLSSTIRDDVRDFLSSKNWSGRCREKRLVTEPLSRCCKGA